MQLVRWATRKYKRLKRRERRALSGWPRSLADLPACSRTGVSAHVLTAGRWEPDEPRGSRPVPWEPEGAIPPGSHPVVHCVLPSVKLGRCVRHWLSGREMLGCNCIPRRLKLCPVRGFRSVRCKNNACGVLDALGRRAVHLGSASGVDGVLVDEHNAVVDACDAGVDDEMIAVPRLVVPITNLLPGR